MTPGEESDGGQLLFDWEKAAAPPAERKNGHRLNSRRARSSSAKKPSCKSGCGWEPGHPWHYLPTGDNAAPMPFEDIPAADQAGRSLLHNLPKARAKRIIKVKELQAAEQSSLAELRSRHEDVVTRGAAALSQYDREIAYGGDADMARAGTLALLFNQISGAKGRLAALERERPASRAR